jgi:hypothetical protein
MRRFSLTLLLAGALASGGCFQFTTLVTVKGDGSGTITEHVLFTSAALAQLRQFAALAGGGLQNFETLSEQQARDAADTMGVGVTYVSSTPIDTVEGQGRDITYAFTDVNQLRLDIQPPAPGGLPIYGPNTTAPRVTFSLTRPAGGPVMLRISSPQLPGARRSGPVGNLPPPDQIARAKPLIAGARLAIVIDPVGQLVRTSSPYVDGRRVTLIDVDADQLLQDETLRRLQAAGSTDDARAALKDAPAVKINFDPEITIEFTPTPR